MLQDIFLSSLERIPHIFYNAIFNNVITIVEQKLMSDEFVLEEMKRKLKVEQAVRAFLHVMEEQELNLEEGLVAWNMLGFTLFQDLYQEASHEEIHARMIEFSNTLFGSRRT